MEDVSQTTGKGKSGGLWWCHQVQFAFFASSLGFKHRSYQFTSEMPCRLMLTLYVRAGLYFTYPRDRDKAAAAARSLHEAAPQEAIHTDTEGSLKSELSFTEEGLSDSEQRRLLAHGLQISNSSLELAAMADGNGSSAPDVPQGEQARLLEGRDRPSHVSEEGH